MADKYFLLNGVSVAAPERFTGEANNLDSDSSTRLEDGDMFIKRIRTGVRKFPVSWPSLTDEEIKAILDIIDNPDIIFIDVTYKDPHHGITTSKFYASGTSWEQKGNNKWKLTTTFTGK